MSTLRINNIEAKSVPASPTIDEKIKLTNSSGDVLVHVDGKTSGITTIGINTTAGNIKFDQNSNVVVTGIITATKFVGTIEPTDLTVSGDLTISNTSPVLKLVDTDNNSDFSIYGAAGVFNIYDETNSASRLLIASDGTVTVVQGLELSSTLTIPDTIVHSGDTDTKIRFPAADTVTVETGGSERFRIDSNGRLSLGVQASPGSYPTATVARQVQAEFKGSIDTSNNKHDGSLALNCTNNNANLHIIRSQNNQTSGVALGNVNFTGFDGTDYHVAAQITGARDEAGGNNDMPGRLVFLTTADGASSPTERLRIDSSGKLLVGKTSGSAKVDIDASNSTLRLTKANATDYVGFQLDRDNSNNAGGYLGLSGAANHYITGSVQHDLCLRSQSNLLFSTGGDVEKLRIDSSGRVLIGATSSSSPAKLAVSGGVNNAEAFLELNRTNDPANGQNIGIIEFCQGNSASRLAARIITRRDGSVWGAASLPSRFEFHTCPQGSNSTAERLRITSDGATRIGNSLSSAAAGRLQVVEERGGQQANDCNAYFETNANDWNIKTYYNSSGTHYHMAFIEQGSFRGRIQGSDGSNVQYLAGSDYRWKENIVDMTGTEGIDICKKLKPRKYNWIENREETGQINTVDGFIAHEVEEAGVLGAVTGEKDAVNEDGSIDGQMLDYGQMTPVLAAAIKGLIDKVETLESKVATLEGS